MDNKRIKELGFSMKEIDDKTIIIEGVASQKMSKKNKIKQERQFSKVALHLYDREYIERLQQLELNLKEQDKSIKDSLKDCVVSAARFLMK